MAKCTVDLTDALFTRTLGKSGIRVSAVGLGTARIGGLNWRLDDRTVPDESGPIDADISAIHRTLDLGIDFFDTADVYGCGHSQRILGQALADRRHQAVVATKFGETFDEQTCQPTEEELNPAYIRRACEASPRRLNTDYIDMYAVMRAFCEARYGNTMTLDHTPRFVEGTASLRRAGDGVCHRVHARAFLERALRQRAPMERAEADLSVG